MTLKQARKLCIDPRYLVTTDSASSVDAYIEINYLDSSQKFSDALRAIDDLERRKNKVVFFHYNKAKACVEICVNVK